MNILLLTQAASSLCLLTVYGFLIKHGLFHDLYYPITIASVLSFVSFMLVMLTYYRLSFVNEEGLLYKGSPSQRNINEDRIYDQITDAVSKLDFTEVLRLQELMKQNDRLKKKLKKVNLMKSF